MQINFAFCRAPSSSSAASPPPRRLCVFVVVDATENAKKIGTTILMRFFIHSREDGRRSVGRSPSLESNFSLTDHFFLIPTTHQWRYECPPLVQSTRQPPPFTVPSVPSIVCPSFFWSHQGMYLLVDRSAGSPPRQGQKEYPFSPANDSVIITGGGGGGGGGDCEAVYTINATSSEGETLLGQLPNSSGYDYRYTLFISYCFI